MLRLGILSTRQQQWNLNPQMLWTGLSENFRKLQASSLLCKLAEQRAREAGNVTAHFPHARVFGKVAVCKWEDYRGYWRINKLMALKGLLRLLRQRVGVLQHDCDQ